MGNAITNHQKIDIALPDALQDPLMTLIPPRYINAAIAHYNATRLPDGPDRTPLLMRAILTKRLKVQGFIIFDDYGDHYGEFAKQMTTWLASGQIKYREHIIDGLENAPEAFIGLLRGENFGKMVIRIADD